MQEHYDTSIKIQHENWIEVLCHSMEIKSLRETAVTLLSSNSNHRVRYQIKLAGFGIRMK